MADSENHTVAIPTPPSKYDRVVKCSEGHLYTTMWVPMVSLKALRFGQQRFQYCPIDKHWSWVERVDEAKLPTEELKEAMAHHDINIP